MNSNLELFQRTEENFWIFMNQIEHGCLINISQRKIAIDQSHVIVM